MFNSAIWIGGSPVWPDPLLIFGLLGRERGRNHLGRVSPFFHIPLTEREVVYGLMCKFLDC